MADYDYILKLDPDNTMTYYNRGLLRMQVGERMVHGVVTLGLVVPLEQREVDDPFSFILGE